MFIYCAVAPTESAHQDGHNGSIGRAICETVGFVPDVPGFRFMPVVTLVAEGICCLPDVGVEWQIRPLDVFSEPIGLVRSFAWIAA